MHVFKHQKYLNPRENIHIDHPVNDREFKVHTHEFVKLIFVTNGKTVHEIDGQEYDAQAEKYISI
ncbi:MAG: hypothetical protein MR332_05860 [Fusicatenibacter sp.]|nr:hypothetical protein [Fusicatenibacter sp.]